ncbi:YcnI family protein [Sporichthya polymorpha]|uniref:YcnI family copper-binding membrane protein n=1 Tax=Sporichthya polymorpha TaxID=35751 RepID=UPI000369D72D|nr:YcnI family protein [Sporichthya polymorpha]
MRRVLTTAALALAGLAAAALPAAAHVTVQPGTAQQGGYATLTFKVPNERDDAGTTKLEVEFPADQPLASVSYQPKPGWTVAVEKAATDQPLTVHGEEVSERVAKVTWTAAQGTRIAPGEFDVFPVSVGPLPTTDQMVFKALQTYEGGEVVRWIEEAAEGSTEEPEKPAPVLTLTPAGSTGAPAAGDTAKIDEAKAAAEEAKTVALEARTAASEVEDGPSNGQVNAAIGLAIAGIVLALIAGGIAGMALGRRSNSSAPPAF